VSVLALDQVTYTYPGAVAPAIADVTLEIGPGELVVLAGGSGSGKSTLLRAANGLAPHFYGGVFAGRATVAGMDTRDHGPGALAAAVGTLFQDPETQVVMGTVRAELALPLENQGEAPAAVARAVEETALALGIAHLLDRPIGELSGGELQRVALGAALAGRPKLILLDEPTSQLDPVAGDELIALLRRLNEDFDAAIVIAEHRLERCLGFADRAIAMRGGRVVCDAAPAEFLAWACASAPELATPGGRLLAGLGLQPVAGVKAARAALRSRGLLPDAGEGEGAAGDTGPRSPGAAPALRFDRVWHEIDRGPAVLRGVSLTVGDGERVALMGRNGAGKSTLLRHAAGLMRPTRGKVRSSGRVALLLQHPGDYLVGEHVRQEASAGALATVGLGDPGLGERHPRDLSGGEKQRLALAIVLDDPERQTAVVCLDEPTRGMDRRRKDELAALLCELDAAVVVATHDPEFVAAFAQRVILLADGAPIADGSPHEVLAGGTYFATETARILGGAGGVLLPDDGVALVGRSIAPGAEVGA
jgi:energy-coupling factor transport system ATP-binding protein